MYLYIDIWKACIEFLYKDKFENSMSVVYRAFILYKKFRKQEW